ncbi:MAG: glutamate--tRNA ligase [Candidatus Niyogibacteria bacterium]|nr:glutamate--tRNA ligase [Candidatus Niyogibacteria bacterium]
MPAKAKSKIRTRIAPSPTGPLHIGTARTALFNYIFARKYKGDFILRIEDTDLERSDPIFERDIEEGLKWLGIGRDEFYRQSERLDIYEKYLKKLLDSGLIFWCYHSQEELSAERQEQFSKKEAPKHYCSFRNDPPPKKEDKKGILRFKNDSSGDIIFNDLIRGKIAFDGRALGDFSVAKDLKTPLYNFAVVIDDYEMKISHVIRGEDHISNTPKQILLQDALNFNRPQYAHLPLILGTDRSKLSKRHGATSLLEYKKSGYLPEAMINFMILLGWHPAPPDSSGQKEKEIFTLNEMPKEFSLDRVQKGGAVFDIDKLKWLNGIYIKKLKTEDLALRLKDYAVDLTEDINSDPKKWLKVSGLLSERLTDLSEARDMSEYFYKEPRYSKEILFWKKNQLSENILRHLKHIHLVLSGVKKWEKRGLEAALTAYAAREGKGEVLWPLRAALSGRKASAGPFEIAEVLGKEETIKRLKKAIDMF